MSRRERLEKKLEKRREWAESRKAGFRREFEKSDLREEKSGIPFGQPILVGHHSEKRHRKMIERANAAFDRAGEHLKMAEKHKQAAAGIENMLEQSIFDDDEDAIERLEERISGNEKARDQMKAINAIIRKNPRAKSTPEKVKQIKELMGWDDEQAEKVFVPDCMGGIGFASYSLSNIGACIRRDQQRIAKIKRTAIAKQAAEDNGGVSIRKTDSGYCYITFADYPGREIIKALKAENFHWSRPSWCGNTERIPDIVKEMIPA